MWLVRSPLKSQELFGDDEGRLERIAFLGIYNVHGWVRICAEERMTTTESLIAQAYSAFNQRNIDAALKLMSDSVSWPKASEGGRVVGKEEIRAYWSRQWKEFDPRVDPVEVLDQGAGRIHVRVHQLVKSLGGDVLSDSEVWHVYTITNGLIERMELGESNSQQSPSSAFSRR